MSERKVLNKYYPPDFDPSKIPRVRQAKNRQFTVRLMAPFNMKCKTCGEYIYKGKKFNARKEDVDNENYLGIRIYRFYIKCTRCLSEISFKTDPASTDYVVEAGATRNFMALKLAEEQAVREMEAEKEEERTNPMKLLENRTKASRGEIEMVETLEELKELNKRKVVVNFDDMLGRYDEERQTEAEVQENEDEKLIKSVFGERTEDGMIVKRLADDGGIFSSISVGITITNTSHRDWSARINRLQLMRRAIKLSGGMMYSSSSDSRSLSIFTRPDFSHNHVGNVEEWHANNAAKSDRHSYDVKVTVGFQFHEEDEEERFDESPTSTEEEHHNHKNVDIDQSYQFFQSGR
uniref:Splicing factor YJU2 n=1 Tax=Megafenestra aurita TaxID=2291010 RepID=A0A4Y7NHM5_9CRUS|nr:EOG090X0G3U [Megafenestra aurita]SVE92720.1 EOG090X0G3U [Megafenestra aurita]